MRGVMNRPRLFNSFVAQVLELKEDWEQRPKICACTVPPEDFTEEGGQILAAIQPNI